MGELWQGGRAREGRVWGIRRESPPPSFVCILTGWRCLVGPGTPSLIFFVHPVDRLPPSSSFTTNDSPSRPPCRRPTRSSSSSHSSSSCSEPTSSRRYNTAHWQPRSGSAVAWSERSYSAGFVPWRRRPSCWTLGNRSLYPASFVCSWDLSSVRAYQTSSEALGDARSSILNVRTLGKVRTAKGARMLFDLRLDVSRHLIASGHATKKRRSASMYRTLQNAHVFDDEVETRDGSGSRDSCDQGTIV